MFSKMFNRWRSEVASERSNDGRAVMVDSKRRVRYPQGGEVTVVTFAQVRNSRCTLETSAIAVRDIEPGMWVVFFDFDINLHAIRMRIAGTQCATPPIPVEDFYVARVKG